MKTAVVIMPVLDTVILDIASRRWTLTAAPTGSSKDPSNLISFELVRERNFHLLLSSPNICMLQ